MRNPHLTSRSTAALAFDADPDMHLVWRAATAIEGEREEKKTVIECRTNETSFTLQSQGRIEGFAIPSINVISEED